jgi:hypothetical protein
MMFGHPVAPIAQRLDVTREIERIVERPTCVAALSNGREIENRKWNHEVIMGRHAAGEKSRLLGL